MQTFFIILILAFGFLITFQIAKASEYVAVLRGEEKARRQTNRINAFLLLAFLVIGLIGVYYCNERLKGKILGESASVQGEKIDIMLYITLAITGVVFLSLKFYYSGLLTNTRNRTKEKRITTRITTSWKLSGPLFLRSL
jgi:cytochrome c oxidase subunit 2